MTESITLTAFSAQHLPGALRLSQQAGWPHRLEDWELILGLSRGIVALDNGEVVATALATAFGEVAMANMIIVDARMRGRGLGRRIMERAQSLAQPREWRLVATAEGLPLYEKLGFRVCGQVLQHQGRVKPVPRPEGIARATGDLAGIVALDRQAFGADRTGLIAQLAARGQLAVLPGANGPEGFAALRDFGRGAVIGPVVARRAADAQRLLAFFLSEHTDAFLRVDTTEAAGLAPWLTAQGLAPVGGGIAMQRGPALPDHDTDFHTYALAAQALG